jgi:LemA protein
MALPLLLIGAAAFFVIIIALILVYYFNRIVVLSNRIDNAWAQIDVQLKKRADLVPNLVETVKGYAKHEKDVFSSVTSARERMLGATSVKDKANAEGELTKALKTVFAIAENYPELKASDNFKLLQEQLDGIESKVAYSRQFYNDSVLEFNNTITTIPGIWFAGMLGKNKPREYFETSDEERKPVKVEF